MIVKQVLHPITIDPEGPLEPKTWVGQLKLALLERIRIGGKDGPLMVNIYSSALRFDQPLLLKECGKTSLEEEDVHTALAAMRLDGWIEYFCRHCSSIVCKPGCTHQSLRLRLTELGRKKLSVVQSSDNKIS